VRNIAGEDHLGIRSVGTSIADHLQCGVTSENEWQKTRNQIKNLGENGMSIIGKLHEISLYGLITMIVCLINGKITISSLWDTAFHLDGLSMFFKSYLFWASVLFIPIAIIGAFATKYTDNGEELTFD
jgi:hypothetical protein